MFEIKYMVAALRIHQIWDQKLKLELDQKVVFKYIYILSEKIIQILQKYLKKKLVEEIY